MNESIWSFFSVAVTFRPTQKTIGSSSRPVGLYGVRTVIAVALPSTLAIVPTLLLSDRCGIFVQRGCPSLCFPTFRCHAIDQDGCPPASAAAIFAAPASAATPGSAGLGDRLFPELGNGGYDAKHYDLGLYYGSSAPQQSVRGLVEMRATATKSLSRFNLDYAGDEVHGVWVDGRKAAFRRDGRELVITPARAIRDGARFEAKVAFTGHTSAPGPDPDGDFPSDPTVTGWFTTADGSVTSGQPDRTHEIYPVNDHPSDKATYSYTIAAPKDVTVAVSGRQTGRRNVGDSTVWSFEMDEPMASQVIQLATGALDIVDRGRVGRHAPA